MNLRVQWSLWMLLLLYFFEGLHLIQQSQSKKDHDKLEHIGKWPPSSPSTEDMRESEKKPTYFSLSQEGFDGTSESAFE